MRIPVRWFFRLGDATDHSSIHERRARLRQKHSLLFSTAAGHTPCDPARHKRPIQTALSIVAEKRSSDDRMSQTTHKSRTTQFIYRFDMNSTFDLSDLSCLSKALASLQVGLMRPHF